jgi:hypothetical protein
MDDAAFLREQAAKCRRLAAMVTTKDVVATLVEMAEEYEQRADSHERAEGPNAG